MPQQLPFVDCYLLAKPPALHWGLLPGCSSAGLLELQTLARVLRQVQSVCGAREQQACLCERHSPSTCAPRHCGSVCRPATLLLPSYPLVNASSTTQLSGLACCYLDSLRWCPSTCIWERFLPGCSCEGYTRYLLSLELLVFAYATFTHPSHHACTPGVGIEHQGPYVCLH